MTETTTADITLLRRELVSNDLRPIMVYLSQDFIEALHGREEKRWEHSVTRQKPQQPIKNERYHFT